MIRILKQATAEFSEDNCARIAAALAYYTIFSLAPLLILLISICGFFIDPQDVQGLLQAELTSILGRDGAKQIETMLTSASQTDSGTFASILSFCMLLLGATGLVSQLQTALNDVWDVKNEESGLGYLALKRLLSFGMICGISFLLLVSLVISSVLSAAGDMIAPLIPILSSQFVLQGLNALSSMFIISLLFASIFKFLPDTTLRWKDVAAGAILTAFLFTIGKFGIGTYLGSQNLESSYGAAGSLALILVWVYYSTMILLFGAEFTQAYSNRKLREKR